MMINLRCISTVIIILLVKVVQSTVPDYIHLCPRKSPNFSSCVVKSIESLRPHLKIGIPELNIPALEPMKMDLLTVSNKQAAGFKVAGNISSINVWGSSDFKILKFASDLSPDIHTFTYKFLLPQLYIEAEYKIDSTIFFLRLVGSGPFTANITNYYSDVVMKGWKVQDKGANYLKFMKTQLNSTIEDFSVVFHDLFAGNSAAAQALNDAINDNAMSFFEEIQPQLVDKLSRTFTDAANSITLSFKYEELFT